MRVRGGRRPEVKVAVAALTAAVAVTVLSGCSLVDSAWNNAGRVAVDTVESSLDQAGVRGVAEGIATSANARLLIEQGTPKENILVDALKDLGWEGNGSRLLGRYEAKVADNAATIGPASGCVVVSPDRQNTSYVVRDCPNPA